MTELSQAARVEDQSYGHLDRFADERLREAERSAVVAAIPGILSRGTIYLIGLVLIATFGLLYFGKVHVVVAAKGRLIPEGDLVMVQALQSGAVNAVLTHAGDRVAKGAALIKLDVSESGVNLADLQRKQDLQRAQRDAQRTALAEVERIVSDPRAAAATAGSGGAAAQLIASLENARLKLDTAAEDLRRVPERQVLMSQEINLTRDNIQLSERNHTARQQSLEAEAAALAQKREQLGNFRRLADNRLLSTLELATEEEKYRAAESALVSGRQRHDADELEISNQKLKLSQLEAKLGSLQRDAEREYRLSDISYQQSRAALAQEARTISSQLQELESNIATTAQRIGLAEAQVSLTTIVAPVAGTVTELKIKNAGELVAAGTLVASVAPDSVPLVAEVAVPNKDIGFVRSGTDASIKIDAFPFRQFGIVHATVAQVLPSVGADNSFLVKIRLQRTTLTADESIHLFPGLTVQADMLTAQQRLISVLFSKQ